MHYDVFNGDADGIFSLQQYRLEYPRPDNQLITGVKRDIRLLSLVDNLQNSNLSVFDISLDSNRTWLEHNCRHSSIPLPIPVLQSLLIRSWAVSIAFGPSAAPLVIIYTNWRDNTQKTGDYRTIRPGNYRNWVNSLITTGMERP